MTVEDYSERRMEIEGWPVNVTSYKIGETYHSKVDNVSPGAAIARTTASIKEEAERTAIERASKALARTKRHEV